MIVCPVCEHAQVIGEECEVCGKRLVEALELPDPPDDRIEALEPTALAGVAVDLAPDPVTELEPTSVAPVGAVAPDGTADLEPTALPGLPADGPTPEPLAVLCRYCRSPAMPGERICGHCGMRLPVPARPAAAVAAAALCGCGVPIAGPLCPSCGARHAAP